MKPGQITTRLSETWLACQANPVQAPEALDTVRHLLRSATLPTSVDALATRSGFGRWRLISALADLEARGEVQLNARGDAIHALKINPSCPDGSITASVDAAA